MNSNKVSASQVLPRICSVFPNSHMGRERGEISVANKCESFGHAKTNQPTHNLKNGKLYSLGVKKQ